MAVSTVTQPQHRVTDASVKTRSGFWQPFRRRNAAEVHEPEPFAPDAQSRWVFDAVKADLRGELTKVVAALSQHKRTVASPTDLDGSHPAYLLRHLAMLALDLEIDPKTTFESAINRLQWAWDMLNDRAAQQAAFERHSPVNAAEAAADGALMAATARRGNAIGPDSERGQMAAAEIVDRAAKAPFPTELQEALTDEVLARMDAERAAQTAVLPQVEVTVVAALASSNPAAAPKDSPLHVADGVAPAVPDDVGAGPSAATPAPLPKRAPQPRPVDVLSYTDTDPYSTVDPTVKGQGLESGAWVFDEGCGTTGPVWFLLAEQEDRLRESGRVAVLKFANGFTREVDAGKPVKVLDVRRAQVLLAEHEQALAAKAAERAA